MREGWTFIQDRTLKAPPRCLGQRSTPRLPQGPARLPSWRLSGSASTCEPGGVYYFKAIDSASLCE